MNRFDGFVKYKQPYKLVAILATTCFGKNQKQHNQSAEKYVSFIKSFARS